MTKTDSQLLLNSISFANRFGFLGWEIFCKYICRGSQASQYRKWAMLIEDHWFVPFEGHRKSLYLSPKAKRTFGNTGASARSPLFHEHDTKVADLLGVISDTKLVAGSWTELELSRQRWIFPEVVGSERVSKIPDLVVDLRTRNGSLRVAIEVEISRKSRGRYAHIALSYLEMRKVDLVLFICATSSVAREITRAFEGSEFEKAAKRPAIVMLPEFDQYGLRSPLKFRESVYTIGDFVERATELPIERKSPGERFENAFAEGSSLGSVKSA